MIIGHSKHACQLNLLSALCASWPWKRELPHQCLHVPSYSWLTHCSVPSLWHLLVTARVLWTDWNSDMSTSNTAPSLNGTHSLQAINMYSVEKSKKEIHKSHICTMTGWCTLSLNIFVQHTCAIYQGKTRNDSASMCIIILAKNFH